jgi:ribonuclease HI
VKINPTIQIPDEDDADENEKPKAVDLHRKLLSEISLSETNLIIYSDGSLIKKSGFTRTGASAVLHHQDTEVKTAQLGLGGRAEVYDGELAGLMLGAREALRYQKDNPAIKHFYFFADNSSAIRGIFNPNNKAGQHYAHRFHRKLCNFLDQNHNNRLTVSWCPSHSDIKGNEKADKLAKEATTLARDGPISTSRSNALRRAKLVTARTWRKQWEKTEALRSQIDSNPA